MMACLRECMDLHPQIMAACIDEQFLALQCNSDLET